MLQSASLAHRAAPTLASAVIASSNEFSGRPHQRGDALMGAFLNKLKASIASDNASGLALSNRSLAVLAWIGWATWLVLVVHMLFSATSRLGAGHAAAIAEYRQFIEAFWSNAPLYIPESLHGFHYLPIMLIIGTPLTWMDIQPAGAIFGALSIGFFSFSVYRLAQQLTPSSPSATAGCILLISLMSALVSILLLQMQMQMPMVAAMICATAAGMRGDWRAYALWLTLAVAFKPLAIVMVLLSIATIPQTRGPFMAGIALVLVLPFAFQSWGYLANEHVNYVRQLLHITDAAPSRWELQADFSTLLNFFGLELGATTRMAIRVGAALATLALAWRIASERNARATSFALLLLSTCYIGLFNPRHEVVSVLVVVPGLAALSLHFIARDRADWRGWIWLVPAVMAGIRWGGAQGRWTVPATMILIWIGLLALMGDPRRWRALVTAPGGRQA